MTLDRGLALVAGCALGAVTVGYGDISPVLAIGASIGGVAIGEVIPEVVARVV